MDGLSCLKVFVGTNTRVISNLDILLVQWEKNYFVKHGKIPVNENCSNFIMLILSGKAQLRIEENFVYFYENNDIIRMSMNQFQTGCNAELIALWFLIFRKKISILDSYCSYYDCMYNDFVDTYFPRLHIVCRYICLTLKSTMCKINENECEARTGLTAWNYFNSAAVMLLRIDRFKQAGLIILDILYNRFWTIITSWDPATEIYPFASKDSENVSFVNDRFVSQQTDK